MPRIFKGCTREQMTKTVSGTLKSTAGGIPLYPFRKKQLHRNLVRIPAETRSVVIRLRHTFPTGAQNDKHWCRRGYFTPSMRITDVHGKRPAC